MSGAVPFPPAPPPLGSAPFVDEHGRLLPWAIILLTQIINGISGAGGIIDIATLGAFAQQTAIEEPTNFPTIARHVLGADPVPPIPRSRGVVVLANGARVIDGYGSPNTDGLVGAVGDLYLCRDGGAKTSLWVCEAAGTGGWVAK